MSHLLLCLLPAVALGADPIDFDFLSEGDAREDVAVMELSPPPTDAPLPHHIWHEVALGSAVPCDGDDHIACAGEGLALFGDDKRLTLYTRTLAPLHLDAEDTPAIRESVRQIEQAAGHDDDEANQMAAAVSARCAKLDSLRGDREALESSLHAEILRAEALLRQAGRPEGDLLRQKTEILADELTEHRALLRDAPPTAASQHQAQGELGDQIDSLLQQLSELAFQLRSTDAALRALIPAA